MKGPLPIVEELDGMTTNAERAAWLKACPLGYFVSDYDAIRLALLRARFFAGISYLDRERVALYARRNADGGLPERAMMAMHLARIDLTIAVRDGGA